MVYFSIVYMYNASPLCSQPLKYALEDARFGEYYPTLETGKNSFMLHLGIFFFFQKKRYQQ